MIDEPTLMAVVAAIGGGFVSALVTGWLVSKQASAKHAQLSASLSEAVSQRDVAVRIEQELRLQLTALDAQLKDLQTQLTGETRANATLSTRVEESERRLAEQLQQFEVTKSALKTEFENLSNRIFDEREEKFRNNNSQNISAILKPLANQIESFQTNVNRIHGDFLQNSASLVQQIKSLEGVGLQMSQEANNLSSALKGDKKLAGNWGEAQLERTLELAGLRKGDHYDAQAAFKNDDGKVFLPDFVVYLPDGKHLIIDSKVSLIDYERAVGAADDDSRSEALAAHGRAVKKHIDDLAGKDYSNLPGISSPDFVLMFMPVEPAYIEAMRNNRELFNYGYQKNVIMVSHTTLMPILRTVANLWMIEHSNQEAKEISQRAGDIYNAVCTSRRASSKWAVHCRL